jgi:hypothetical protein
MNAISPTDLVSKTNPGGAPKGNRNAIGNKGGRPGSYNPKLHPQIAEAMASVGAPESAIARQLGIATVTLWRWKLKHVEFCNALALGKERANEALEALALQLALGYSYETQKAFSNGVVVTITETMSPSERMLEFLLRTRLPKEYG